MQDLETYLALCEAATPGPWKMKVTYCEKPGYEQYIKRIDITTQDGYVIATFSYVNPMKENAIMITTARTGWPETIKRAMAIELERDELKEQVELLEAALEVAVATLSTINWDWVHCPKDMGTIEDKCRYDCEGQERIECWKRYFLALAGEA